MTNRDLEDLGEFFDIALAIREKRYGAMLLGVVFWFILLLLGLVLSPIWLSRAIFGATRRLWLKFRRWASDTLRPKDIFKSWGTERGSDLINTFVNYEKLLVNGKETADVRSALISSLAHAEQELEEYRLLFADIRRLHVEDERTGRRDAILATRARADKRRKREQRERKESERTE